MEEKKKGNGGLVVLVIILLLLCIGMGAFIFIKKDKIISKNETKSSSSTSTEKTDLDVNDAIVINLFNIFRLDRSCYMNVKDLNSKNITRLRLASDNLTTESQMIECSKVGGMYEGRYCGSNPFADKEMSDAYNLDDKTKFTKLVEERMNTEIINPKELKAKYLQLFGSDADYKDEDFGTGHSAETSCGIMHYDQKNHIYAQYNGECGGTCATGKQEVTKSFKESDKLTIETKYENEAAGINSNVTYEFKFDNKIGNYVFVKVTEE